MPDKPTVTQDHHERYSKIMNTTVKPAAGKSPPISSTEKASLVSSLLSTVATPKGIGNKVFVFTGKKKIVLDGKEKEEEKIKTVDMTAKKAETKVISSSAPIPETPPEEELKIETMAQKQTQAPIIEPPKPETKVMSLDKKIETPKIEITSPPIKPTPAPAAAAPQPAKKPAVKTVKSKKMRKPIVIVLLIALFIFTCAWTVFWAVFFGLWSPSFLGNQ